MKWMLLKVQDWNIDLFILLINILFSFFSKHNVMDSRRKLRKNTSLKNTEEVYSKTASCVETRQSAFILPFLKEKQIITPGRFNEQWRLAGSRILFLHHLHASLIVKKQIQQHHTRTHKQQKQQQHHTRTQKQQKQQQHHTRTQKQQHHTRTQNQQTGWWVLECATRIMLPCVA